MNVTLERLQHHRQVGELATHHRIMMPAWLYSASAVSASSNRHYAADPYALDARKVARAFDAQKC